jgi:hypothetical protein
MPAAVSGELGFTTPPKASTIGVTATARPVSATRGAAVRSSARTDMVTKSAVMSTVTSRISHTAPAALGHTLEIPPTSP